MKIRWLDRLTLIIASLFLGAEAVVLALLALGYGQSDFAYWSEIMLQGSSANQVILCVVAALLLLIALRLLILRAGRKSFAPDSIFMLTTEAGSVRITLAAIEAIVQRVCRANAQVRDTKVRIVPQENQLSVVLRVVLSSDANAKDVSVALQASVKSALEDNTGIPVTEVQVIIEVSPAALPQRAE